MLTQSLLKCFILVKSVSKFRTVVTTKKCSIIYLQTPNAKFGYSKITNCYDSQMRYDLTMCLYMWGHPHPLQAGLVNPNPNSIMNT